jgi:hypothetical protein
MIVQALQIVAALGTIVTGLIALIWPRSIGGFTGLHVQDGRSTTEIRAALGGFYVGLGTVPLVLNAAAAYQMLGITYLVVSVVRAISMFVDRSVDSSNVISLVVEIVFGVILLL